MTWSRGKRKEITCEEDSNGCWNCTSHRLDSNGYPQAMREGKRELIHRLFYRQYIGEIPQGLCVLHRCDNPRCINPDHLFVGTHKDNTMDSARKGRHKAPLLRGEEHGGSKLTEEAARSIVRLSRQGVYQRDMARMFGVSPSTISMIVIGKTWKHIRDKGGQ